MTADGDGGKAVRERKSALVACQLAGNGAVGLCIADKAADCSAALDTVAAATIIGRLICNTGGEQASVKARSCAGVNISAAICDKRIEARCADERAGSGIVVSRKVAALDNGVDNAQSINGGIDISEKAGECIFAIYSGQARGIESIEVPDKSVLRCINFQI